jgi:hypothetical protein
MATAVRDLWGELDAAGGLPFGVERSALVESLVAEADALGDEKLALTCRLQLMTSYSYGGEPLRRFPVFGWLVDRYAASPELFDEASRYRLLWMFKWVTVGVTNHPAVPRNRIEARLEEMAEHFAAAGEGPAPVLGSRFQVIARMDGHPAAEEAYRAWVAAPRTALSDCEACEPGIRVWHLTATERFAEALDEAAGVLQAGGCTDQPQRTIGHALEPLLQLGFAERAGQEHLRGVRLLRSAGGSPTSWARHILACARGGQLYRGLDLLEDRLPDLQSAPTPWDAMWLAAAGGRLLRALELNGEGDLPVLGIAADTTTDPDPAGEPGGSTPGEVVTSVGELLERLTGRARRLAARFDERNGNDVVSGQVERWLNATPLPSFPLPDVLTRRRARTVLRSGSMPVRPEPVAPEPVGIADLAADWQHALDTGDDARRAAVLRGWRRSRSLPEAEHADPVLAARLEAALAIDDVDRGSASVHDARGAARLLREAGDAPGAWLHELACLRRELSPGDAAAGVLARAEAVVGKGSAGEGPGVTACLHVGYVALLQAAGLDLAAAVERGLAAVERRLAAAGADPRTLSPVERGCVALLLRDRASVLPEPERADALAAAYGLLAPGERVLERALVGLAYGTSLESSGALTRAREVLAGAADDASASGDAGLAAHAAHALGRACQLDGDTPAAVEVFRGVLTQLGPDQDPVLLAQARQDLALALRDAGELVTAAELAEGALAELEHHLAGWGLPVPPDLDWRALGDRAAGGDERADDAPVLVRSGEPAGGAGPVVGGHLAAGPADNRCAEGQLAGTLAFTAAICGRDLGESEQATSLACRSATWHRGYGLADAEAESLELAAHCSPDPHAAAGLLLRAGELHTAGGRWIAAATCRRALALPLLEVSGLASAERALTRAQAALAAVRPQEPDRHRLSWERVALADQAARVLAGAGQLQRALEASQGLDDAFRALDDARSARDVIALRAQVLEELGRAQECLTELHDAALEARSAGDERQALQLGGYLAAFLDDLGRHDEADTVWTLFTP